MQHNSGSISYLMKVFFFYFCHNESEEWKLSHNTLPGRCLAAAANNKEMQISSGVAEGTDALRPELHFSSY